MFGSGCGDLKYEVCGSLQFCQFVQLYIYYCTNYIFSVSNKFIDNLNEKQKM